MSCQRTRQMLDAWIDGELDAGTADELSRHAALCPACTSAREERIGLRATLATAPRHAAPAALRDAVVMQARQTRGAPEPQKVRRADVAWWQAIALSIGTAAAAVLATVMLIRAPTAPAPVVPVGSEVVARYVNSLATQNAIEVASSDRHTVKPWFQGKVPFSPPVRDLTALGFQLEGARLDRVAGSTAAVLVYRIRKHSVQVFVWPAADETDVPLKASTLRGFSVATWSAQGLNHVAVSDVDPADVDRLVRALR